MYSITYLAAGASEETMIFHKGDFNEFFDCRVARLAMAVNSPWSLSLTIGPSNPAYSEMEVMRGEVRVYDGEELLFRGRPFKITRLFTSEIEVDVEGLLACLCDVEFSGMQFSQSGSGAVTAFLTLLLVTLFNPYMTDSTRQILLQNIAVSDPSYLLSVEETDPISGWELLTKYTVENLGGYLLPDYSHTGYVALDYLATLPAAGQGVTFAQNLLDLTDEKDGSDIVTLLFPRGKDGLTIGMIANGTYGGYGKQGAYLYDSNARSKYGSIVRYVDFDDLEAAEDVLYAGVAYMDQHSGKIAQAITARALDLSLVDTRFSSFRAGTTVTVTDPSGSASYPLTEVVLDIVNPPESTITINSASTTISGRVAGGISGTGGSGGAVVVSGADLTAEEYSALSAQLEG